MKTFLYSCIDTEADKRPTPLELLEYPWAKVAGGHNLIQQLISEHQQIKSKEAEQMAGLKRK